MLQLLWLALNIYISPLIPPVLVPLSYSRTRILLLQKADPLVLSIISVWAATLSTVTIRFLQNHIIEKLTIYDKLDKQDVFSRIVNHMNRYFKNQKRLARIWFKREQYIETRAGKFVTFLFAILCYVPILPDIITTRILYKKIKFKYFLIALIIGKSITHVPFIYAGKTLFQLLLHK